MATIAHANSCASLNGAARLPSCAGTHKSFTQVKLASNPYT
ncbi:hypothetical protein BLL52_3689 [Rhodoferax antarcticus ANT.BR]|uniref:Uncharacterized protein n=1 Tax=Rhodoferax antarcticus ANT.BR TaxID=1111071 RepID=A0A1Q8YA70_9BURK|nr:hypothetical protein BLL52_3689 [Rhodoferax antarcticus ANT.BR]